MAKPSVRDLVDGLRAKAQGEGSDPQRLPGAVYGAKDVAISFGRPETRTWHPNDPRPVIVVSSPRVAQSLTVVGVHVVPCSSQIQRLEETDLRLPDDEPGFSKPSVALVNLTQEVPKKYLTGYIADLRPPTLQALVAKLCQIGHPAGLGLRGSGPAMG